MITVETQNGSKYEIKNGRITRNPGDHNRIEFDVANELFSFRSPLEVGSMLSVFLWENQQPLRTSPVVKIEGN